MSDALDQCMHIMNRLNTEELVLASKHLKACYNTQKNVCMLKAKIKLDQGDTVNFKGRNSQQIEGTIKKFNRTTVTVDAGVFGIWNVAASLLTPGSLATAQL